MGNEEQNYIMKDIVFALNIVQYVDLECNLATCLLLM